MQNQTRRTIMNWMRHLSNADKALGAALAGDADYKAALRKTFDAVRPGMSRTESNRIAREAAAETSAFARALFPDLYKAVLVQKPETLGNGSPITLEDKLLWIASDIWMAA